MKSTNLLERLNEEIKRRTRVVRIFPNPASCLRLVRALCTETHEAWLEGHRYINMDLLAKQQREKRITQAGRLRFSLGRPSIQCAQLDGHNRRSMAGIAITATA